MKLREIVLDTETTGRNPLGGDRILEIAAIELVNHIPTGREFYTLVDPGRDSEPEALAVHGIARAQTQAAPQFATIVDDLLGFLGDAQIVAHNARFDFDFLNMELARIGRPELPFARAIDTVAIARRRFPGAPANLDALCRRFEIDLSVRGKHSAIVDTRLLAEVYLELVGGRQPDLALADRAAAETLVVRAIAPDRPARPPRRHGPSAAEAQAHAAFIARLKDPLWAALLPPADAGKDAAKDGAAE